MNNKIYLTWQDIENGCKSLAEQIPSDIEILLPITRGGLFIAGFLSQILDIRDIRSISIKAYTNENKFDEVDLIYLPEIDYLEERHKCLIVDDILDTGKTIDKLTSLDEFDNILIACLYKKKHQCLSQINMVTGTYENDDWIVFPWEDM